MGRGKNFEGLGWYNWKTDEWTPVERFSNYVREDDNDERPASAEPAEPTGA